MFRRKLIALGYTDYETIDIQDDRSFRRIIQWVEENCMLTKNPEICKRFSELDSDFFVSVLSEYLLHLDCPWRPDERFAVIDWLLRKCVAKEYDSVVMDRVQVSNNRLVLFKTADEREGSKSKAMVIEIGETCQEPQENNIIHSEMFEPGVDNLAKAMHITLQTDGRLTLRALAIAIERLLQRPTLTHQDNLNPNAGQNSLLTQLTLDDIPLGINLSDNSLSQAVKIIRMLHIAQLRDLQTKVDGALVALQSITAEPKTDQGLGHVGR